MPVLELSFHRTLASTTPRAAPNPRGSARPATKKLAVRAAVGRTCPASTRPSFLEVGKRASIPGQKLHAFWVLLGSLGFGCIAKYCSLSLAAFEKPWFEAADFSLLRTDPTPRRPSTLIRASFR